MRRRRIVAGLLLSLAAPLAAEAQPAGKVSGSVFSDADPPAGYAARSKRFRLACGNSATSGPEHRHRVPVGRGGARRLPDLAAELVRLEA